MCDRRTGLSQLGPTLELATRGYSSTHNKALQVLPRTEFGPAPEVLLRPVLFMVYDS